MINETRVGYHGSWALLEKYIDEDKAGSVAAYMHVHVLDAVRLLVMRRQELLS